jgi:glycosyltransferase involved in cell wall biosynthesis
MMGSTRAGATLRVGFDGRSLRSPAGGVRRYARQLLEAMCRAVPDTEIVAIGANPGDVPPCVRIGRDRGSLPTNAGWMLTGVPLAARGLALDVFHAPAYTAPLVGVAPLVLTIHDVSYARQPGDYPYRRDRLRRWFYAASARRAHVVVTDSSFSAREIHLAYGIPLERITVIPLGVDRSYFSAPAASQDEGRASNPYLLHVGDLHARRRIGLLLDATLMARTRHPSLAALRLVLVGRDHDQAATLTKRAVAAGAPDAVDVRGVVPDADLLAWMRGAAAFVYASRYEGFGLPLLEAMACGVPVVAAAEASVPEVVGDAGRLVSNADAATFADAIAALLLDPTEKERLRQAGLARAAAFTWERTARHTADIYARVARGAA